MFKFQELDNLLHCNVQTICSDIEKFGSNSSLLSTLRELHEFALLSKGNARRHDAERAITLFTVCTIWECSTPRAESILSAKLFSDELLFATLAYTFFNKSYGNAPPTPESCVPLYQTSGENIKWEVAEHRREMARVSWLLHAQDMLKAHADIFADVRRLENFALQTNGDFLARRLLQFDDAPAAAIRTVLHPHVYRREARTTGTLPFPRVYQYHDLDSLPHVFESRYSGQVAATDALLRMVDTLDGKRAVAATRLFDRILGDRLTTVDPDHGHNQHVQTKRR